MHVGLPTVIRAIGNIFTEFELSLLGLGWLVTLTFNSKIASPVKSATIKYFVIFKLYIYRVLF